MSLNFGPCFCLCEGVSAFLGFQPVLSRIPCLLLVPLEQTTLCPHLPLPIVPRQVGPNPSHGIQLLVNGAVAARSPVQVFLLLPFRVCRLQHTPIPTTMFTGVLISPTCYLGDQGDGLWWWLY